jgi:hypothetical protein
MSAREDRSLGDVERSSGERDEGVTAEAGRRALAWVAGMGVTGASRIGDGG